MKWTFWCSRWQKWRCDERLRRSLPRYIKSSLLALPLLHFLISFQAFKISWFHIIFNFCVLEHFNFLNFQFHTFPISNFLKFLTKKISNWKKKTNLFLLSFEKVDLKMWFHFVIFLAKTFSNLTFENEFV